MKLKDLDDQWLIKEHFFGMYEERPAGSGQVYLVNPTNTDEVLPSSVIQNAIDAAVSRLEKTIRAAIRKTEQRIEFHDYDQDLFGQYVFIELDQYPVADVTSLELVQGEHGATVWTVPEVMIQLHDEDFGMIQILPIAGSASTYDPAIMPLVSGHYYASHVPSRIKVTYTYGMDALDKDLDPLIIRAIGMMAAIQPLDILGDILIGAGVASISTSFDGISQSVNTTASAENSAMSARIKSFERQLYGDPRTPGLVQALQTEYRRIPLALL